ncbi:hypothetical protein OCJ37_07750 [Xanthomonas sp. AM6]|uniref:hypothetical protein n=1 Tax=Xanthomonas sp. AM6 TaxID=2982531 RepID=UPI0021D7EF9A|nr:hypothetical protein [Xanthomonas sp. AM6]UYB53825.1 hypothetical protein OCJ37_07750 [Xanthomonas sp. AM6]
MDEPLAAYVEKADGDAIRVRALDHRLHGALAALGFAAAAPRDAWTLQVADDAHKATAFGALRALGVAFADGREWCPAEVFAHLREHGLLSGTFLRIAWTGPGHYRLAWA